MTNQWIKNMHAHVCVCVCVTDSVRRLFEWLSGRETTCKCKTHRRHGLDPWWQDPLEEETATHCSILAGIIPWTEKPGGLQSMGSQSRTRLRSWSLSTQAHTHAVTQKNETFLSVTICMDLEHRITLCSK